MSSGPIYRGHCFCGAVELAVTGTPVAMGYCHCASCRAWAAAPLNAFTLWRREQVNITRGREHLASFQKTERSIRKWCRLCGGHVLAEHPSWGVVDIYAAVLPNLPFRPAVHVNYRQTVLPLRDGLPKQQDVPAEMGGSGVLLPE